MVLNSKSISVLLKNYKADLLASLALAVTFSLFAPVSTYVDNANRLNLELPATVIFYFVAATIALLILVGLILIIRKIFPYISVIYLAISYCFLVQGTLLAHDLGVLDGRAIQWSTYRLYSWLEFAVWGTIVCVAIIYRKAIRSSITFGVVLLFIAELSMLLGNGISNHLVINSPTNNSSLVVDDKRKFEYSSEKNVVIIIIDTFRGPAFEDAMKKGPNLQNSFKDFTFFTNTLSDFPNTYASIPSILTGIPYDNQITTEEYLNESFSHSLPVLLSQNGFETELYPLNNTTLMGYPDVWDNVYGNSSGKIQSFQQLFWKFEKLNILTLIRFLPLAIKPPVVNIFYKLPENNSHSESVSQNPVIQFYEDSSSITKTNRHPVFKFIHLPGVHPPFVIDNLFSEGKYSFTYDSYTNQAAANLIAVSRYLENLKSAGVYDNSLIIIMGDHGIQPFLQEYTGSSSDVSNKPFFVNNYLPDVGLPLLLVKDVNKTHDRMIRSNEPVILSDIPRMISQSLNIENDFDGLDPLNLNIPSDRKRYFYFYDSSAHKWGDKYMPPLFEYIIQGYAADVQSWRFTGNVYNAGTKEDYTVSKYKYGDNIVGSEIIDRYGNFLSDGFYVDAKQGLWAVGPISCLHLPVEKTDSPLLVTLSIVPFINKKEIVAQRVNVLADNHSIESLEINNETSLSIPLSAEYTVDGLLNLCFEFPDAKYSPQDLEMSDDPRYLGGLFRVISINETNPFSLPIHFDFRKAGNTETIRNKGWSSAESEFTWTEGQNARLIVPLDQVGADNIKMTLSAFPFTYGDSLKQQLVVIRSTGIEVGRWVMDHDGEYTVNIPSNYVKDGFLEIEFEIPNAASPVSLGMSQDPRILGMAVRWLRLEK